MRASHAVSDSDDWPGHFSPLDVDEMKQVARVVEPACWLVVSIPFGGGCGSLTVVAQGIFIDHTAFSFPGYVGHPDAPNAESSFFRPSVDFLPERLV